MSITISNELQCKEARDRINRLAAGPRSTDEEREFGELINAINFWQLVQAQPVQLLTSTEYERAKARIEALSDALEGTPQALELAGLIEVVQAYDARHTEGSPLDQGKPAAFT